MGMERVSYVLGDALGLPVPRVCLEEHDGEIGSLQWRVDNARSWKQAPGCPMLMNEIVNEEQLPLSFLFDAWIANIDRVDRNLLAQSVPATKPPKGAQKCKMWLIDNGCTGLWFPSKFDPSFRGQRIEDVDIGDGAIHEEVRRISLGAMPQRYRQACTGVGPEKKRELFERIGGITDDFLEETMAEIPQGYISDKAKENTVELLRLRRESIGEIYDALVP